MDTTDATPGAAPCEACERRPATRVEPTEVPSEPMRLCGACDGRLQGRALRPREWFNLAKRHGWRQYLLGDDFYDEDGSADQPEDEVDGADALPAPTLEQARHDADALLDWAISRWWLDDALRAAWAALPAERSLATLASRFDATRHLQVRSRVLELAAVVGPPAAGLARRAWDAQPDGAWFGSLLEATAACLPPREGFDRAVAALDAMPPRERRLSFGALAHLRSPWTLRWIESHVAEPLTEDWGRLAAASAFGWPDATRWLDAGRPLNLVAIDALLAIAAPRSPWLASIRPRLAQAPDEATAADALRRAVAADPVPRVKQRVGALLPLLPALLCPDAAP